MRYFSTFSGIGGFELGIQLAYESFHQKPICVGYSEIDKYASQIYNKHFPEHKNYGDITKIDECALPDFDVLVGGFPCQSFSIAGKRGGFNDTRGTLFFDVARILKEKQPPMVLLENVKGLLSHEGGNTFRTILGTFDELGYDAEWQVLNSKNHGVPQNRERVFIVGHLRGTPRPEIFPSIGQSNENTTISKSAKTAVARTLTGGAHTGGNHSGMTILQKDGRIRRLTPIEWERLQGFPDGWTEGVSDTQRYKTLGNAVTVNVVQAIIMRSSKLFTEVEGMV